MNGLTFIKIVGTGVAGFVAVNVELRGGAPHFERAVSSPILPLAASEISGRHTAPQTGPKSLWPEKPEIPMELAGRNEAQPRPAKRILRTANEIAPSCLVAVARFIGKRLTECGGVAECQAPWIIA